MDKLNIVITGHVDHGKSTFIGRLLYETKSIPEAKLEEIISTCKGLGRELEFAYLLDAFKEEVEGQLTIDTTQVVFRTPRREYVVIDTPGHKEFLKNMVTGASYAEAAILIISAKDGIEEQTKRHAYILQFFGIKQIIIVINKMDNVGYSKDVFDALCRKADSLLSRFGIVPMQMIPISAKIGDNIAQKSKNMPWYEGPAVLAVLDNCKKNEFEHDFRMPIQDIYNIDGMKAAVGRVYSGSVNVAENVTVFPAGLNAGISSIRVFEGQRKYALTGENIALILNKALDLKRGDVICAKCAPVVKNTFSAIVLCLEGRLAGDLGYTFQIATQVVSCRITKFEERINIETLENGSCDFLEEAQLGRVKLAADSDLVFETFDKLQELGRFVLRRKESVVGVGIII